MIYVLFLGAYLIGLILSRWSARALRTGIIMVAVSGGITLGIAVLLMQEMMGGLIFGAFLGVIGLPVVMLGLGLIAGGIVRTTWRATPLMRGLGCFSSAIIPTVLLLMLANAYSIDKARIEALTDAQALTLSAEFGPHPVSVPVSPMLQVDWDCAGVSPCRSDLMKHVGDLATATPLRIWRLEFAPVHATCEGADAPLNRCVPDAMQNAWCEMRPDMAKNAFCTANTKHPLFFWDIDGPYHPAHDISDWAPAGSIAAQDNNVALLCNPTRDSVRATNGLTRLCGVNWEITPGVMAGIRIDKVADADVQTAAHEAMETAKTLWTALRP